MRGELILHCVNAPSNPHVEAEAERLFRGALCVAQNQQSLLLELRASISLGRLWYNQGKDTAAQQILTAIYRRFTEGLATPDLQEAQSLLAHWTPKV